MPGCDRRAGAPAGHVLEHDLQAASSFIISNAESRAAALLEAPEHRRARLAGSRRASHATACAVGSGCSFRHAPVMMPSVPSEPMKRCFRSKPVLFLRRRRARPRPAVGQHDFEAEHVLARVAVAQHAGAAGVRGDVAADLARAFGAEADRVEPAGCDGRLLHGGEHATGFDHHRVVGGVDRAHARACAAG